MKKGRLTEEELLGYFLEKFREINPYDIVSIIDDYIEKIFSDFKEKNKDLDDTYTNDVMNSIKDSIAFFYVSSDDDFEDIISSLKSSFPDFHFHINPLLQEIMDIASDGWNNDIDYIRDLVATYAEKETGEYECDEFGDKPMSDELGWDLISFAKETILNRIDIRISFSKLEELSF